MGMYWRKGVKQMARGSIFRRKSGNYAIIYYVDGKRMRGISKRAAGIPKVEGRE
jgi:hypothetical protein